MARAMKDSGVEWIGEIPEEWQVKRLKFSMTCKDGERIPVDSAQRIKGPYPYWGAGSITDYVSDYLFDEELVLLGEDGAPFFEPYRPVAFLVNEKIWVNNHIHVLKPHKTEAPAFMAYALNSVDYHPHINGSILSKLTQGNMREIALPSTSLLEQQRIADFLDAQTAEIDASIAKTQESIEEYKKLKQAVITQAVTKGIRPGRAMKDSGVEWIGEIPEEWSVSRLKHHTYIRARLGWKGLKADEYVEQGYPMLSAFNIVNSKLKFENLNYINKERYDESPEIKLSLGDVLLVKDGAGIGKCAVVSELPMESTVNGSIALVTADNSVSGFFLYYFFLSAPFVGFINYLKDGMGVPHLFQSDLREITFPLMDLQEQHEIVANLDEKCAAIDTLIEKKQAIITELEAYKKSLIYEYVTGKKEVPVASC